MKKGFWLLSGYAVLATAAIVWLAQSLAPLRDLEALRMYRSRDLMNHANMVSGLLVGVAQNLEAAAPPPGGAAGPELADPLVNADATMAQLELALLELRQATGKPLPIDGVLATYSFQIKSARRVQSTGGTIAPEALEGLRMAAADVRALHAAYPADLLARSDAAELAAVRAKLPELLKSPEALAWLKQTPDPGGNK